MKRLFAFDIDGTLLDSSHNVLPSTKLAIKKIFDHGDIAIIATGRPTNVTTKLANEVGIFEIVSSNGAIYFNARSKKYLFQTHVSFLLAKKLFDLAIKENAFSMTIICEQGLYVYEKSTIPWLKEAALSLRRDMYITFDASQKDEFLEAIKKDGKILKIELTPIGTIDPSKTIKAINQASFMNEYEWFFKEKNNCGEFVAKGINKWTGISKYIDHFKIDHSEIYTFGDDANDLEMIQNASHGVAMGNAKDFVKKVAKHITASNDEDGIAKMINKIYEK